MAVRYCLACGAENSGAALMCRECGHSLRASRSERAQGVAFLLNELQALRAEGEITQDVYLHLRQRYLDALGGLSERAAPAAAPSSSEGPPPPRAGPSWLAEQQANLLLYLGAFLIVLAVLIFVGYSEQAINDKVKMALLVLGTLLFLTTGLACLRFPRVQQAGVVFFAVGALMVPLNFVGAYAFFVSGEDIDPTGLWLAGSLSSALLYGAISLSGMGRWYPVPAVVAAASALAALLVLTDAPPEAYPGSMIALALLIAVPSMLPLGRLSDAFGEVGYWAAHGAVPLAIVAAFGMTAAAHDQHESGFVLATRWYLPPTIALAAFFYATQALSARRALPKFEPVFTVAALGVAGAAAVTLVFALNVGQQWYGPAVAIVGGLYAAGSEGFGPRWFGQRHLGGMALGAITVSWLFFEGVYADFPRQGAGVHFAASAFYLVAARLVHVDLPLFQKPRSVDPRADQSDVFAIPAAVGFIYAAGLTLGIGFYHLLSSLPAAETARASDLSWPFFGLSLALAGLAATMRWWWPDARLHVHVVALGMSLFVLLSSVEAEGQEPLLLAIYTAVALALALWEREPLALALPATFGFFAVLAAWRYYEPNDAYLPLAVSGIGYGLFAAYLALRGAATRATFEAARSWGLVALLLAFAYVAAAPIAGLVRLSMLADPKGFVGSERFEATLLYQTTTVSVLLAGLLLAAQSWLVRRWELTVGSSVVVMVALLLEIGHFRPENVQAYTAPAGVYLLAAALLALRVPDLPHDLRALIGPLETLGAAVLMGPSLVQSWEDAAWRYGLLLLGEGLGLLVLALTQRRLWLLGTAVTFVVLDGLHYLFFAGGPVLPSWAILAIAGAAVMAAGTAILLSRDQWTEWQRRAQAWWRREASPAKVR